MSIGATYYKTRPERLGLGLVLDSGLGLAGVGISTLDTSVTLDCP